MTHPRTFYITKFPDTFRDRTWFEPHEKDAAEKFIKHVKERYGVQGELIETVEVKRNKK